MTVAAIDDLAKVVDTKSKAQKAKKGAKATVKTGKKQVLNIR